MTYQEYTEKALREGATHQIPYHLPSGEVIFCRWSEPGHWQYLAKEPNVQWRALTRGTCDLTLIPSGNEQKSNDNCLAGYRCPKCGSQEPFLMDTTCIMKWFDNGTDADGKYDQHLEIAGPGGNTTCCECDHQDTTYSFRITTQDGEEQARKLALGHWL